MVELDAPRPRWGAEAPNARADWPLPARPGLSRDRVVEAALAIVDRDGLDGLTMRRLASELGVEAMSLLPLVPERDRDPRRAGRSLACGRRRRRSTASRTGVERDSMRTPGPLRTAGS